MQQAVAQSGWRRLQQTLCARYDLSGPALPLREGWLVAQLLAQVRELLGAWKRANRCRAEVRTTLADLTTLASTAGPGATARQGAALAVARGTGALGRLASRDGRPGALSGLRLRSGGPQERPTAPEEVLQRAARGVRGGGLSLLLP